MYYVVITSFYFSVFQLLLSVHVPIPSPSRSWFTCSSFRCAWKDVHI